MESHISKIDQQAMALGALNNILQNANDFTQKYTELRVAVQKELNELEKIRNQRLESENSHTRQMEAIENDHFRKMNLIKVLEEGLIKAQKANNLEQMRMIMETLKHYWV